MSEAIKKVEQWKCELCNSLYNTAKEAQQCSDYHITGIELGLDLQYRQGEKWPNLILIKGKNGYQTYYKP